MSDPDTSKIQGSAPSDDWEAELSNRARRSIAEAPLEPTVHQALDQARRQAVSAATKRSPQRYWWGGGIAVAAAALLTLSLLEQPEPTTPNGTSLEAMLSLASSDADFELLEELEFYAWLEEAGLEEAGSEGGGAVDRG